MKKPDTIFQKMSDWIRGVTAPLWLKYILQDINDIVISLLLQVGRSYLTQIRDKIIQTSEMDVPNEVKFEMVYQFVLTLNLNLKESVINLLIEMLVNRLKKQGII